jgi:hypothetical protein
MIAALSGKPVYDQSAPSDTSEVVAGQWSPRSNLPRSRQRQALDNDFTRALFGF